MDFKFSNSGEIKLVSTNVNIEDRWTVMTTRQMENVAEGKWSWFYAISNRNDERTKLHLGYDEIVGRPVIVKTVEYRLEDLKSEEGILDRRRILMEQIELLNNISSPLLPEPLDWFTIENTIDGLPEDLRKTEPVLVLDYQPGKSVLGDINKKKFRFNNSQEVHTPRVARLALRVLYFLRTLRDKNYAYIALSPEHVLLLKDDIPRFVGLGRICRLVDNHLDSSSVNFNRTLYGYSAPELNDPNTNWGELATAEQVGAFSLGVLLHQIVYESTEFTKEMISKGSFKYPNGVTEEKIKSEKNGELIHKLLVDLCNHNPQERLTDFDQIEKRLRNIEGGIIDGYSGELTSANRGGVVKFYEYDQGYGFIVDNITGRDVFIPQRSLELSGIKMLPKGCKVRFDVYLSSGKEYAGNIRKVIITTSRNTSGTTTRPTTGSTTRTTTGSTTRPTTGSTTRTTTRTNTPPKRNVDSEKPNSPGWCFISTAVYGTPTAPKLDTLRWFRDYVLRTNDFGRRLLLTYFRTSPKISHKLRGMKIRKGIVRKIIDLSYVLIKKVQREKNGSFMYWMWSALAVSVYYIAFLTAYIFVLPERILGIETTDSIGEDE